VSDSLRIPLAIGRVRALVSQPLGFGRGIASGAGVLSLFIAVATLLPGYRIHRNRRVLLLGGIGLALLLLGALAPQDLCCFVWLDSKEIGLASRITPLTILVTAATPLGCGLLVAAHFLNRRYLHSRRSYSR
jgi:hypothetical protein